MPLHLIVSCTDRKRLPVEDALRLRNFATQQTQAAKARAWKRALASASPLLAQPARTIYAGEHWVTACDVERQFGGPARLTMWVASAGYGLVRADAPIHAYSATFAPGQADSIDAQSSSPTRQEALESWWEALCSGSAHADAVAPRSVRELALAHPRSPIVLVAAPDYVRAMAPDMLAAVKEQHAGGSLAIISSSGASAASALAPHLVIIDDRARATVGGTLQALGVRTLRHILSVDEPNTPEALRARYRVMVEKNERPERPKRPQVTDEAVLTFIRQRVQDTGSTSHTRLLREFRDSGQACEQARFRRLFNEAVPHAPRGSRGGS